MINNEIHIFPSLDILVFHGLWCQHSTNYGIVCIKVEVKFTLEQATKTQKGSRGIALLFL